jgi:hypothetical protein
VTTRIFKRRIGGVVLKGDSCAAGCSDLAKPEQAKALQPRTTTMSCEGLWRRVLYDISTAIMKQFAIHSRFAGGDAVIAMIDFSSYRMHNPSKQPVSIFQQPSSL